MVVIDKKTITEIFREWYLRGAYDMLLILSDPTYSYDKASLYQDPGSFEDFKQQMKDIEDRLNFGKWLI